MSSSISQTVAPAPSWDFEKKSIGPGWRVWTVVTVASLFAFLFAGTIALRLVEERRMYEAIAGIANDSAADRLADHASREVARFSGLVAGAAASLRDTDEGARQRLALLRATPGVLGATVASDAWLASDEGAPWKAALEDRPASASFWVSVDTAGEPFAYAAADIGEGDRLRTIVARIAPGVLFADGAPGEAVRIVASRAQVILEGPEVDGSIARDADDALSSGSAPVIGADLTVELFGLNNFNAVSWRRTLIFYSLLGVSPLVAAFGLSAILLSRLRKSQSANRAKSAFLANMSHELRTPLNAINGFSEAMMLEMFGPLHSDSYKECAQDIVIASQHLLSLINDVIDMARIDAGKLTLALEDVDPHAVVEECLRLMRLRADAAGVTLVDEVGDAPGIHADKRVFRQIILNIVSNAVKFTPEGGQIVVSSQVRDGGIRFSVVDNGIGISEQDLARLGRPFEQVDNRETTSQVGSGLGLALSRHLAQMHGGDLIIESVLGEGTSVHIDLPL